MVTRLARREARRHKPAMSSPTFPSFIVLGAGASGLMAARDLARAGRRVTVLEARDRCGGRIYPLPDSALGMAAEGGAEFVHGAAPLTRAMAGEAGLTLVPLTGQGWTKRNGALTRSGDDTPHAEELQQALASLDADLPIAEFLDTRFAGETYATMRRSIIRMTEGYDAADPARASTFALREEWLGEGIDEQHRIGEGYGALIDHLARDVRDHGGAIRLGTRATAIESAGGRLVARTEGGADFIADAVVLAVPLPLLRAIALPPSLNSKLAAIAEIGFGNVVKLLLRFRSRWWTGHNGGQLARMSFVFAETRIPTWWTQYPREDALLTGWYAGPKADGVENLSDAQWTGMALASLAGIFDISVERLNDELAGARVFNWSADPLARGAYSYATPKTRAAQAALLAPDGTGIYFAGEALYPGRDMGTVEAALAAGREAARQALAEIG